jgi:PAS domain S-box-containing protein
MSDEQRRSDALRQRAEAILDKQGPEAQRVDFSVQELVHELLVYQVELEMQNEELRRAQEEIDRTKSRYVDLYDFAPVGYFTLDKDGIILETNLTGANLLGVDRGSSLGQPLSVFMSHASQRPFYAHLHAVERDCRKEACELTIEKRDSGSIEVRLESTPVAGEDGSISIRSAMIDITDSKRAEAQRVRLALAVDQAPDAVYMIDANGRIAYGNGAFCYSFGYGHGEAVGRNICSMGHEGNRSPHESLWSTIRDGGMWSGRLTEKRKDGASIETEASVAPVKDSSGGIVGYVGVCRDITERLQLEEQLRQSHKMEALGILAGGIAHDFNNILAAIIGFTELSIGHAADGSRDRQNLERVLRAGLRGRDLVKQMLAFGRTSTKKRQPMRLSDAIRETTGLLRASVPATIRIAVDIKTESGLVLADPVEMQQILMNLCVNATDAMKEQGGVLRIELSDISVLSDAGTLGLRQGPHIRLTVSDTGKGIGQDIMDRIFDPFFTTKGPGEGTGLGLSMVRSIVTGSEGAITVESKPSEGTTFRVYFPIVIEEQSDVVQAQAPTLTGHERILFVDDEELLVEMITDMLHSLGYQVTSTRNSSDAVDLFRKDPAQFDLVIADQTMPGLSGLELAEHLLSMGTDIPVILSTGFSRTVDAERATAAGIRAFIMKPFTQNELARTVRDVLDRE